MNKNVLGSLFRFNIFLKDYEVIETYNRQRFKYVC